MGLGPALAATAVSGVLYALAFPPLRFRALAWVALVPLLIVLRDAGWRRRVVLGAFWTLVSGWSVGTWMAPAVAGYFEQPLAAGIAIFLVVTMLMAAPYYAAFAVAYRPLTRFGAATPLLVGAAWAAAELARGRLLNGTLTYVGNSPWATFGYAQAGVAPVVQIASMTGVYGVSFLLAAANAALADVAAAWVERRPVARGAWTGLTIASAVVASVLAWGVFTVPSGAALVKASDPLGGSSDALVKSRDALAQSRDAVDKSSDALAESRPATAPAAATPIAIVQGNVGAVVRWSQEGPARTLETYGQLTRDVLARGDPRVVFWPEAAVTTFIEQEEPARRALATLQADDDAELVIGAPRAGAPNGGPPFTNSIYVVGPDGALTARYDKEYLLPFMEYFPLRVELARRRFGRVREFSPGAPTPPLPTRAGAAGILVCNEAFLPHVAADRVVAGAEYLVNPSNDSWVPNAGFAWQQLDIASLRAVEQRRWLVRVSDSGPSAIVDPFGRVVAHTDALTRAALVGAIEARSERSVYARVGDLFGIVCALLVGFTLALAAVRRA